MTPHAEELLEFFDWTGLEVEFQPITLDRFKGLLTDALLTPLDKAPSLEQKNTRIEAIHDN